MTQALFSSLQLGALTLAHRVVMAPLTRMRASQPGNVPHALNVEYYRQRTSKGGLIITEGAQISPTGQGMPATPGIHSQAQIEGWKAVTDAVHAKGGLIFLQLWHVGRISHPSLLGGELPVAPSAIAAPGNAFTATFERAPFETPRALEMAEIASVVGDYAQAARNAQRAGFDGVEIHGANGYLLEQFLQSRSNQRTDAYGGSIENRCRIVLEVAAAVSAVFGADRVGVRLSPFGVANGSGEDEPFPLYSHLIRELAALDLAYLHLIEPRASGAGQAEVDHQNVPFASDLFRPLWPRVLIAAGNYTPATAAAAIEAGRADAIAFGRLFIANPDLPDRARTGAALNPYNRATFYGGGVEGYTDYPWLDTRP
ncbi:alkene reductase [Xanthomonas hortorum]|uniref:Alkene reductase n=1 Tax=Xanthomonas hortorum pv. hederae TaxID=453603 RepID=A0A9X3YZJ3_9XANT|nr:alkene reductase [Xanthomonas hortorum]MCE4369646.1 alkene reductase [Xanthomonas hortorum pv. hederae]MDC8637144.1 alkene reductase [Xanthomonas hortorum pv. hederae]PPU86190.1 alkene reductase [Xanthomonas hortorum pv. hederae]PUF01253.1 alkene reductase [Xanthomonas hortorum pv. hederae]